MAQNMKQKQKYWYNCPIRGKIERPGEEEGVRIDLINYLIDKNIFPKENIAIEVTLLRIGHKGKNSLRADLVIFDTPVSDLRLGGEDEGARVENIEVKENLDRIVAIGECKFDPKDMDKAIEHQLVQPMKLLSHARKDIIGIYADSVNKNIYQLDDSNEPGAPLSIFQLADIVSNNSFGRQDLIPVPSTRKMYSEMEQKIYNLTGGKMNKHREILKLLISKYYDEALGDGQIEFTVRHKETDKTVFERIENLYSKARSFYDEEGQFTKIFDKKLNMSAKSVVAIVKILEHYSLNKTNASVIQEFYMKFAPYFLRKDLDQYYTPKQLCDFMTENLDFGKASKFIDPACGAGDFMVGVLRHCKPSIRGNIKDQIHCWDKETDAAVLAQINMILNGDGRSHVKQMDSLENNTEKNNTFDYVIANPPFGKKTTLEGSSRKKYSLFTKHGIAEVGKLFVERSLNLLMDGGLMLIILPSGYMENPEDENFREFVFENFKIIGLVGLPDGVFKQAGANGRTCILIARKKSKGENDNYTFFVDSVHKIGFEHGSKNGNPIFTRDEDTGTIINNENNEPLVDNQLLEVTKRFRKFCYDYKIKGFIQENYEDSEYNTFEFKHVMEDRHKRIRALLSDQEYKNVMNHIEIHKNEVYTLDEIGAEIMSNTKPVIESSRIYEYVETGSVMQGILTKDISQLKQKGWELAGRAKIEAREGDFLLAKLGGSVNNYYYVTTDNKIRNRIYSNGFYRIRIEDERMQKLFLWFLLSPYYIPQIKNLATGTIMYDVKEQDIMNDLKIILPTNEIEAIEIADNFINSVSTLELTRQNLKQIIGF